MVSSVTKKFSAVTMRQNHDQEARASAYLGTKDNNISLSLNFILYYVFVCVLLISNNHLFL